MSINLHKRTLVLSSAMLLTLLVMPVPAQAAEQGSLAKCQAIRDKITYYTDLRRDGGSSSQMSKWQKKKHEYRKAFSKYKCREHGNKIKS